MSCYQLHKEEHRELFSFSLLKARLTLILSKTCFESLEDCSDSNFFPTLVLVLLNGLVELKTLISSHETSPQLYPTPNKQVFLMAKYSVLRV